MQTSLEILNPLQMLDLFYKRMRLIADLTLQMRSGLPKHPTPPFLPSHRLILTVPFLLKACLECFFRNYLYSWFRSQTGKSVLLPHLQASVSFWRAKNRVSELFSHRIHKKQFSMIYVYFLKISSTHRGGRLASWTPSKEPAVGV